MLKIDRGPQRLVLKSGSTTVVLDKEAQQATLQRKILFWARKPIARRLSSISEARVETNVDPASSAEISSVMLKLREGGGWVLRARDKNDATAAATTIREFLAS